MKNKFKCKQDDQISETTQGTNLIKKTKFKIHKSTMTPLITYAAEKMCLSGRSKKNLRILERKILCKTHQEK